MRNQKGFSLIELLAVILISSSILVPLLFSLAGNVEVNDRVNKRNAASQITISTIRGFDTIRFRDILDLPGLQTNNYIVFTVDNCNILPNPTAVHMNSREICEYVFTQKIANYDFTVEEFKLVIYPIALDETVKNTLLTEAANDLPEDIVAEMNERIAIGNPSNFILNITVWIDYSSTTDARIIRSEVIARD